MFSPRVYNSKRFESVSKRITTRDVGSGSPYQKTRSNNNEEEKRLKGFFALSPLDSYVLTAKSGGMEASTTTRGSDDDDEIKEGLIKKLYF